MSALTLENAALLAELPNGERKVALYSSSMPSGYRFRRGDENQLAAWIGQGIARIGRDELQQRAARSWGFHLLSLRNSLTEEIVTGHRAVFPDARRELRAGQVAALTVLWVGVNRAALTRNAKVAVPGVCPCQGTGRLPDNGDPDYPIPSSCPIHWQGADGMAVAA